MIENSEEDQEVVPEEAVRVDLTADQVLEGEIDQKCIQLPAQSVEIDVKCHLNRREKDQYSVASVSAIVKTMVPSVRKEVVISTEVEISKNECLKQYAMNAEMIVKCLSVRMERNQSIAVTVSVVLRRDLQTEVLTVIEVKESLLLQGEILLLN